MFNKNKCEIETLRKWKFKYYYFFPGLTLYELHAAQANLAYLEYSKKEKSPETSLKYLLSAEETLKSALKHLLYEPKKSPEGFLAQNALGYLKKLRESIKDIRGQLAMETCLDNFSRKKTSK